MANRIDNSLAAFSSRPNLTTQTVLTVVVGLFLIVGLILSVAQQQWPFTALFGFGLIGTAMIGGLSYVRLRRETAAADSARLDWHTALPEVQRQSLQIEVRELARVMEAEAPQAADLQSAYIVAEDLALRQIQQEENIPLFRHISIGKVPFDAVFIKNDILHCCEVSFLIAPDFRQDKIDAMLRKAAATREMLERLGIKMRVRLIVILITQLTPEDDDLLRSTLGTKRFSATPVDVDIRFLDFEALQGIYITD